MAVLDTAVRATFDASGFASAVFQSYDANALINIKRFSSSCGGTSQVTLIIYRNMISPAAVIDSTYTANAATSETDITLLRGERLIAVWTKGTPGSDATLNLNGTVN